MEYKVDQFGNTTITIRKYLIHNIKGWQKKSGKEFYNQDTLGIGAADVEENHEDEDKEINTHMTITYHKLYEFGKLFEYNKLSMKLLE